MGGVKSQLLCVVRIELAIGSALTIRTNQTKLHHLERVEVNKNVVFGLFLDLTEVTKTDQGCGCKNWKIRVIL